MPTYEVLVGHNPEIKVVVEGHDWDITQIGYLCIRSQGHRGIAVFRDWAYCKEIDGDQAQ